jgi:intein-encoded DNA endonuclease-like protein
MPTTLILAEMPTPPFKKYGGDIMSVVGLDIISKREERRKYLPLEMRMKMYEDVIELRRQGLSHSQIQKRVYEEYGRQVSLSLISYWVNGKHHPLGNVNKFDGKSSPELAYVIGVILSDGYKCFDEKNYFLRLAVIDKEYAEEFGRCLARVLGKKEPYKPYWNEKLKQWIVIGYSVQLYKFLDKPLEELKIYIEHCKDCISAFLRALFDGEGSMPKHKRALRLYNTNKELLIYTQYLLKRYFNIDTTGPYLATRKGTIVHLPNNMISKANGDCYYIYIPVKSLLDFYKHIGFTIKRKQQRLIKATLPLFNSTIIRAA